MYFVCGPGLRSTFPASVSIVRRAHRGSRLPAHVAAARGRLAEKTTGVRPPLGGRTEVAGEKVSLLPRFGRFPPPAGRCIGSLLTLSMPHSHRSQAVALGVFLVETVVLKTVL